MASESEVAALLLEATPRVMAQVRAQMRAARSSDLTVVQFRLLGHVVRHEGSSLSEAADHLGLALPAASKQVQGFVERRLLAREAGVEDRRQVALRATAEGRAEWRRCREATQRALARQLASLTPAQLAAAQEGLKALALAFAPEVPA